MKEDHLVVCINANRGIVKNSGTKPAITTTETSKKKQRNRKKLSCGSHKKTEGNGIRGS